MLERHAIELRFVAALAAILRRCCKRERDAVS